MWDLGFPFVKHFTPDEGLAANSSALYSIASDLTVHRPVFFKFQRSKTVLVWTAEALTNKTHKNLLRQYSEIYPPIGFSLLRNILASLWAHCFGFIASSQWRAQGAGGRARGAVALLEAKTCVKVPSWKPKRVLKCPLGDETRVKVSSRSQNAC